MLAQRTHPNHESLRCRSNPKHWVIATSLTLLLLLTGACNGGSDNESATSVTPEEVTAESTEETPASQPSPTQVAVEATPTPAPTMTPMPSPTPDPLVTEAVAVVEMYYGNLTEVLGDARDADISTASRLEAKGSPVEGYTLTLVNSLLKANHFLPSGDVRYSVSGAEVVNPDAGAVDVYLCIQTGGIWRDFDSNEITRESATTSFLATYEVRRDGAGSGLKVWNFSEADSEGHLIECDLDTQL